VERFDQFPRLPIFSQNSLADLLLAIAVMVGLFFVLVAARKVVRRYHRKFLQLEGTQLAEVPLEVLSRTTTLFFVVLAVFTGLQTLTTSASTARVLTSALTIALFFQAGVWASAAASGWLERRRQRSISTDRAAVGSLGIIGFVARVLIWTFVALLTLENVGVDVTALVAGLGIGGIAVALAVQNILGDLFASLSITLDKPFVVGDFLIVGDVLGSVEHIGIKSTRLRSLSGEQIVISNADLLGSRVRNYGRMMERRVVFQTRVTYETPIEQLERIPKLIREIVESIDGTRFDRSHLAIHSPGSIDFETVYYVLSPDYNRYMDIQQTINLRLHREFAKSGIEFAYPTQKLLLSRARGEEKSEQDVAAA
jgi:small-conductance mechanosensitive channel